MTNLKSKCIIFAILAAILTGLGGCGGRSAAAELEALRLEVAAAERVSVTARVTADLGETVEEYVLSAERRGGETVVEVLEPELIAGVRARLRAGEDALEYDGVILSAGELSAGASPLAMLPTLLDALAGGHVDSVWREDGGTAARLTPEDGLALTVWLSAADGLPAAAELMTESDGRVAVACEITGFELG